MDPASALSIERQCALLGLARSSFYYAPCGESAYNLELMQLTDKQYLDTPFSGWGSSPIGFAIRGMKSILNEYGDCCG